MKFGAKIATISGATTTVDFSAQGFSATDPIKGLVVVSNFQTATGTADGTGRFSVGFVSEDGGAVQHQSLSGVNEDNQGTSWCAVENSTTRCLVALDPTAATTTVQVEGYSVANTTDFGNSSIVFTRNTGSVAPKFLVIAIGGADVTRARAFGSNITSGTTAQDITIAAGVGQPDLVITANSVSGVTGVGLTQSINWGGSIGFARSDTERFCMAWFASDNAATSTMAAFNTDTALGFTDPSIAGGAAFNLGARAGWPTDGIEIVSGAVARSSCYLNALGIWLTANAKIGGVDSRTSTGLSTFDAGFGPDGGIFVGANQGETGTTQVSGDSGSRELGAWTVGAFDGTNEGSVTFTMDDNNATENTGGSVSDTKAWQGIDPVATGAPIVQAEADGYIAGSLFGLNYTDADTVATRRIGALAFGTVGVGRLQLPPFQGVF